MGKWPNLDKIEMIDQGGNASGDGPGGINRFAQTGPTLIFGLLQQLQALGLSWPEVLAQLGIETNGLTDSAGEKAVTPAKPNPPKPATPQRQQQRRRRPRRTMRQRSWTN